MGTIALGRGELADVPHDDAWLTDRERAVLTGLRFEKRRRDWRLGRWTAKHAVAHFLGGDLDEIAIVAGDDGAPRAMTGDARLPVAISITHRDGIAVCAVAEGGVAVGCDLELVEQRPAVFAGDWFTDDELARLDAAPETRRAQLTTLTWAAKEAAMKARHDGLRVPTRRVVLDQVATDDATTDWHPLVVRWETPPAARLAGWWTAIGRFVLVVAAEPPPDPPTWQ